ncbi:SusC/RagA family TonB-linked outer membrane protein [Flexithrix dorotheae]|uniref:SusC/RagA family TonB-linked outer membrane protein n=1 Tax=Flexithrix dorotheae TaxID=70993 RepID=UPI0003A5E158|nr:TonB-dependent receptor [Flexithrix dorotheae]
MKKELIRLIKMLSKNAIYGIIIQCIFYSALMADKGKAQSVNDIFISVEMNNATLEEAFSMIQNETQFKFSYAKLKLDKNVRISTKAKVQTLAELLGKISKEAKLKFVRINDNIVVDKRKKFEIFYNDPVIEESNQDVVVSGTITSGEDGQPLPGVSVVVKGTTSGTVTDIDGKYKITAPSNASITYSYIGFVTQEIEIGNQSTIDVTLAVDLETLEEVVVVGYGTQEKRNVTAAIASLDAEQIKSIPAGSSVQAMQGQVAGVDIMNRGGRPGQSPSVRIRGRRSITASNDPLYVIDGIPQTSGSSAIFDINPQDIESMEVLKDAAASAIYGSRGANGVIIITTKRGATGRTEVSYDGYYGVTSAIKKVDMMNGEEFAAMKRESRRQDPNTGAASYSGVIPSDEIVFDDPTELESIALGRSTNYQDLVLDEGYQTNHQLSVTGGNEKTQFNISLGYFNEQGIISNMDYERITGRINLDHKISNIFKAGISFLTTNSVQNYGSNATMGEALANNPLGVPYNEDGTLRFLPTNDGIRTNPLNELVPGAYVDERKITRVFAPVYLEANIIEGLTYRLNFGPDIRYERRGNFRGSLTNTNRGGPAGAGIVNYTDLGYTLENIVNFNRTLGSKHDIGFTGLQSIQSLSKETHFTNVSNLPYETQSFYNLGTAEVKGNLGSYLEDWQLASFMGRVNYEYDGKYLFQVTLRADGSSRLAEGNKWQTFPGLSAGWRIIEEGFMANQSIFSELKLRASYGEVGNTSVDPYQTWGRLRRTTYAWDESPAFGFGLAEIPNQELGWEISKTSDVGVDFGFFNGRLSGSFDWYKTNTENLLLERNLPYTSGYNNILQNIGSTQTSGVELTLGANILDTQGGFTWDLNFNIAHTTEKITELALKDENGNAIDDVGNGWFIGQPLKVFYDYEKVGIWQLGEETQADAMDAKVPGEIKLADLDGDGLITPDDRKVLGSDIPDYTGGITNNLSYKGFDLGFFFYFRVGHMIRSGFHQGNNSLFARYNNLDVDYWTIDNPSNEAPRPNQNQEFPRNGSTLTYFDGSYVKLRNVTFAYNFPSNITDKLKMTGLRLYFSAQNPWFAAKYDSYDPEINDNDDSNSIDDLGSDIVPTPRLFLMGLNVKF